MNRFLISLFMSCLSAIVLAQGNQSAHKHGEAEITLVFQDNMLAMEIIAPAEDIVGFEHHPETKVQEDKILAAHEFLSVVDNVIALNPACALVETTLVVPHYNELGVRKDHGHDDHDDHEHDDHEHHSDDNKVEHSSVELTLAWDCSQSELVSLTFNLFEHYKKLEKAELQWVVNGKQGIVELTPNAKRFSLPK